MGTESKIFGGLFIERALDDCHRDVVVRASGKLKVVIINSSRKWPKLARRSTARSIPILDVTFLGTDGLRCCAYIDTTKSAFPFNTFPFNMFRGPIPK